MVGCKPFKFIVNTKLPCSKRGVVFYSCVFVQKAVSLAGFQPQPPTFEE